MAALLPICYIVTTIHLLRRGETVICYVIDCVESNMGVVLSLTTILHFHCDPFVGSLEVVGGVLSIHCVSLPSIYEYFPV